MDVERIQKINSLALELMKQGLAADRESAIQQAEQIFKGEAGQYTEMKETMQAVEQQKQPELTPETSSVNLNQDKITDILKQNTEYIVSKLKEFQKKVQVLEQEVSMLKNKVRHQDIPTVKEIIGQQVPEPTPTESVQETSQKATAVEEAHPKGGDYAAEDVAVEKMFYFGNK